MKVHLDTNTLIRFFSKDDTHKALQVKKLLESKNDLVISDVVFPELEYVLEAVPYSLSKHEVCALFRFLISRSNITVSSSGKTAVQLFEKSNLDMADCI